ncbi:MAG: hypothetical protein GYA52_01435 [Chloroflexi bacterium]|nr:hypothetical protein [Chloroflexota bacterium]
MNLTNLSELQNIDSHLDAIRLELKSLHAAMQRDGLVATAEQTLKEQQLIENEAQKTLNRILDDIEKKKIKLAQSDAMLYSGKVQNPKELQDLQLEIDSLQGIIATLEDKQLDQMIKLEDLQAKTAVAKLAFQKAASAFETQKSQAAARIQNLENENALLLKKRDVVLKSIQSQDINLYEQLRKRKNGLAIVSLENDACAACGTQLTPSEKQDIRSSTKLFFCPTCGRILYAK